MNIRKKEKIERIKKKFGEEKIIGAKNCRLTFSPGKH